MIPEAERDRFIGDVLDACAQVGDDAGPSVLVFRQMNVELRRPRGTRVALARRSPKEPEEGHMEIRRFRGQAVGRNRAVEYNGLVWTVATAPNAKDSVAGQTRQCLAVLERSLDEAGSGKTRIISAQIFLVDMATKPEMDEVWNAWIGPNPDHWPQRACVGAALADGCLVEIILLAAKS